MDDRRGSTASPVPALTVTLALATIVAPFFPPLFPFVLVGAASAVCALALARRPSRPLRLAVAGAGAGVGIFDSAPGTQNYGNVVIHNRLVGNGLPGVTMHSHTPHQNLTDNVILGNYIAGNGADTEDAFTPFPTGINVYGVSAASGTVISQNIIKDEGIGIAVKTPAPITARTSPPESSRVASREPAAVRARPGRLAAATGGEVEETTGRVGGGALPLAELPSFACSLEESLAAPLRAGEPPVVGIVRDGRLLLDCLTLTDDEAEEGQGRDGTVAALAQAAQATRCHDSRARVGVDDVTVVHGDTDRVPWGGGTWADRGAIIACSAALIASGEVKAKLAAIGARLLAANPADGEVAEGVIRAKDDPSRCLL